MVVHVPSSETISNFLTDFKLDLVLDSPTNFDYRLTLSYILCLLKGHLTYDCFCIGKFK